MQAYRRQRELLAENANVDFTDTKAHIDKAWDLDKWKPLPIAAHAYSQHPQFKWYIIMDDDSYIIWPNMLRWLSTLNPSDSLYIGAPAVINGEPFAHGGSGVVLSHGLVSSVFPSHPGITHEWEAFTAENCCGDHVFAHALAEIGVSLNSGPVHSRLQGDAPTSVRLSKDNWCSEIVSFHHVSPREIENLYIFENLYGSSHNPILYRDIYSHFVKPYITDFRRENWDNGADDREYNIDDSEVEEIAHRSYEDCKARCVDWSDCLQFRYKPEFCALASRVRLGSIAEVGSDEDEAFSSEWMVERIRNMRGELQCEKVGVDEEEEGSFFRNSPLAVKASEGDSA